MSHAACHWPPGPLVLFVGSSGLGVTGSEVLSKCQGSRGIFFSAGYIGGLGGQNEWAWLHIERKGTEAPTTGPGDPPNGPSPARQQQQSGRLPQGRLQVHAAVASQGSFPSFTLKRVWETTLAIQAQETAHRRQHHALPHTVPTLLHQALPCPLHCIPSLPLSPHSHNDHVRLHMGEAWDEKQL